MRGSTDLDELDLLLVTALQTSPRASWERIGQVLDVTRLHGRPPVGKAHRGGLRLVELSPIALARNVRHPGNHRNQMRGPTTTRGRDDNC
jgi:hypothetical protein